MRRQMMNLYRRKRRYLRLVFMLSAGVFAGLLECEDLPPFFCLFGMLPLFTALECRGRRELVVRLLPFLAAYDFTKTSFLLTLYTLTDMQRWLGVLCSLVAASGAAAILLVTQVICLSFFCNIRTGKARDIVSLSLLFSASEWLCENLSRLSFPWLGVWAQADGAEPLMMTAKLLGCRFTSFVILLMNGIIFLMIRSVRGGRIRSLAGCACCFALLTGFTALYGSQEISALKAKAESSESLNVMTVQLDCEGREKSEMSAQEAADRYTSLIDENFADNADVIFLPETAVHTTYKTGAKAFEKLERFAAEHDCTILTGCFYKSKGGRYNGVIALTPDGIADGTYFKTHLVPFGEYVPFSGIFGKRDLSASCSECKPIEVCGSEIGCGICIESIYSDIFRSQTRIGAQLIYIPTNDSWFGNSYARRAHYLHSKMRAIENSRYVVRSGNCGISAVIAPWGEEIVKDESKECGALAAEVRLMDDKSVYTVLGDTFILAPLSLVLLSAINGAKARIRNRTQA